tara:strand:- start:420 stop:1781 length:1362 start_codon:yes stop_codon:yes gene_type:complete
MTSIRNPAVAGTFYPGRHDELMAMVDAMLADAPDSESSPKVIIVPHAGYVYSGSVAAQAYRRLAKVRKKIKRVVLLGPSHRVGFRGIAASSANSFSTPLGKIPLDVETIKLLTAVTQTTFLDKAHAQEHSLEVQLPFLQRSLDQFQLIPLVVGDADKKAVAEVLEFLWGGEETLIVISSDLSHYHPYDEAKSLDAETSGKILALQDDLQGSEACGCRPLNGLLYLAGKQGMRVEQLAMLNSGDTAGPRDKVVGYGAYVINHQPRVKVQEDYSLAQRQIMLQLARDAIQQALLGNKNFDVKLKLYPQALLKKAASFVTINLNGALRGCIGSLQAHRPLLIDIIQNAQSAAFRDPRFKPLSLQEYQQIDIHISVLTEAVPFPVKDRQELLEKIRPGKDGLIIRARGKSATYLPSVWEKIPQPEDFITELRRKAGLDPTGWDADTEVMRYQTVEFS